MSKEMFKDFSKDLLTIYRPPSLSELSLPSRIMSLIETNKNKKGFRFMFHGSPGTGKTTVGRLLSQGTDVMYLSGSNEFKVETMRTKVYPFIQGHSVSGNTKTLFIDEFENISNANQDAFKVILDTARNVNMIFITNEIQKVNDAILSRCTNVEFNYQADEIHEQKINYTKFIKRVVDEQGLKYDVEGLKKMIALFFPDFRKLLVVMQQFIDSNKPLTLENVEMISETGIANIELYEALTIMDSAKFYEAITKFKGKERDCLMSLGEPFFNWLNKQNKYEQTIKASIAVSKHCNHFVTTMNKFGTFFACCSELKSIIR